MHAHLEGKDDGLAVVAPVLGRVSDFAALIAGGQDDAGFAALRAPELTGRPLESADFIEGLERILWLRIAKRAPGRKATHEQDAQLDLLPLDEWTLVLSSNLRFDHT